MRLTSLALAFAVFVCAGIRATPVAACSADPSFVDGCTNDGTREAKLPANTLFPATWSCTTPPCEPIWVGADRKATWVSASVPGSTRSYFRLAPPLPTTLTHEAIVEYPYGMTIRFGPEVTSTPGKPALEAIRVELVEDPSSGSGYSCPDVDSIRVRVRPRAGEAPPFVRFYMGLTPEEASTSPVAEVETTGCLADGAYEIHAGVGVSAERPRSSDGKGFQRKGRFCFTADVMDIAGNASERSTPECLATDDPSDPHVTMVESESSGCLCRAAPPTRGGTIAFAFAVGLFAVVAARRRARR